jgi:hypothetical protein
MCIFERIYTEVSLSISTCVHSAPTLISYFADALIKWNTWTSNSYSNYSLARDREYFTAETIRAYDKILLIILLSLLIINADN